MIDKLINFCKENPSIEYIAISWEDWNRLCNEVNQKRREEQKAGECNGMWSLYWSRLISYDPTFGKIKILIKDKIAML